MLSDEVVDYVRCDMAVSSVYLDALIPCCSATPLTRLFSTANFPSA